MPNLAGPPEQRRQQEEGNEEEEDLGCQPWEPRAPASRFSLVRGPREPRPATVHGAGSLHLDGPTGLLQPKDTVTTQPLEGQSAAIHASPWATPQEGRGKLLPRAGMAVVGSPVE